MFEELNKKHLAAQALSSNWLRIWAANIQRPSAFFTGHICDPPYPRPMFSPYFYLTFGSLYLLLSAFNYFYLLLSTSELPLPYL